MNWTEYFINIANTIKLKSKDNSTKIGVVIVGKNHEIVSTGYNSFPRGIDDNVPERQERPEKYYWMTHAEINSILNAARTGISTKDCVMYMTCGIPCTDCAKAIINSGISEIYCSSKINSGWEEHAKRSKIMFKESSVKVNFY